MNKIIGKVVQLLNERELIINVGSNHGVTKDMIFNVLDPKGENLKDPETGEILGSIKRVKISVMVKDVYDKMSTAITYKKDEYESGSEFGTNMALATLGLSGYLMPKKTISKYETFLNREKHLQEISEKDSFVKIGDPVEQEIIENIHE